MNTKTTLGLLAAIVIIVIAFFVFHKPAAAPVALPTATTTPQTATTTGSTPKIEVQSSGSASPTAPAPKTSGSTAKPAAHVAFDQSSLVTPSAHPTITGTATNVTMMAIVIDNAQGVGVVGSGNIPVVNGHWSYTSALGFAPGSYTVHILGNGAALDGTLVISQ